MVGSLDRTGTFYMRNERASDETSPSFLPSFLPSIWEKINEWRRGGDYNIRWMQ